MKKKNIQSIQQMKNSLDNEKEKNDKFYQIMIKKIEELNKECINRKKEKKISYELIETDDYNVICTHKNCYNNCHIKCSCNLSKLFDYFCGQITFLGNCKICGHGVSEHFRKKLLFEEHEEEIEDAQFMNYFNKQLKIIDKSISIIKIKQEEISNQKLMLEGQKILQK